MVKNIKEYKGLIWFSLFKYTEIAFTSLTTFIVAKKIGPYEMGIAIPLLLFITYSNYLSLGVNQSVIKNYSKYDSEINSLEFIKVNAQFIFLVCLLSFVLSYFLLDSKYFLIVGFITAGNLLRSFFMSYFRVINKVQVINKNSLFFSFLLLCLSLLFVKTLSFYLFYWAISLWISLVIYFFDGYTFFISIIKRFLLLPGKKETFNNFIEGIKLASTGIVSTILLTTDRFIINDLNVPVNIKGSYQLADYVGSAYYLFLTTIVFYFYPKLIVKLRNQPEFKLKYIKYIKRGVLFIPVLLILTYLFALIVGSQIFPEYKDLEKFIVLIVLLKSGVFLVTSMLTLYIAMDKETVYVKSMLFTLAFYLITTLCFIFLKFSVIIYVPLILSVILGIEFFNKLKYFERN